MKFDRQAPGQGMEIYTKLENGKAMLEFAFFLEEEPPGRRENQSGVRGLCAEIYLYDGEGGCVMRLTHPLASEELARGLLLHPHLWSGEEDPYLYQAEVFLKKMQGGKGEICDRISRMLPLCAFQRIPGRGWFLNGKPFVLKAVKYHVSGKKDLGEPREVRVMRDMKLLRELGANAVCLTGGKMDPKFYELCCKNGFVVLQMCCGSRRPPTTDPVGTESLELLSDLLDEQGQPDDRYYYYKALWSKEPFVYLCRSSLTRQPNGLYRMTAYSNLKKLALYVEGILFEFQSGAPEFLFTDIQIPHFPAALTAEADSCSMSVTVYGV